MLERIRTHVMWHVNISFKLSPLLFLLIELLDLKKFVFCQAGLCFLTRLLALLGFKLLH